MKKNKSLIPSRIVAVVILLLVGATYFTFKNVVTNNNTLAILAQSVGVTTVKTGPSSTVLPETTTNSRVLPETTTVNTNNPCYNCEAQKQAYRIAQKNYTIAEKAYKEACKGLNVSQPPIDNKDTKNFISFVNIKAPFPYGIEYYEKDDYQKNCNDKYALALDSYKKFRFAYKHMQICYEKAAKEQKQVCNSTLDSLPNPVSSSDCIKEKKDLDTAKKEYEVLQSNISKFDTDSENNNMRGNLVYTQVMKTYRAKIGALQENLEILKIKYQKCIDRNPQNKKLR